LNIAVFVSGRGSNLQAILDSECTREIVFVKAVISDKIDCAAFQIAAKKNIPTFTIGKMPGSISYSELISSLKKLDVEFVVLAGFLKLIPIEFLRSFQNKIINIHPALLPSYGGPGMYGMNVHRAVFKSGDKYSGATIHLVDEHYDSGKIIAQDTIDISDVNSPEELADKVLEIEHKLLPSILRKIAEGKVDIKNSKNKK
jgi:formyltetrahydrofolate-dependent phosphoribosylglycinamide formyltransferase